MFAEILEFFTTFWNGFKATWFVILPVAFYVVFKSLWGRHAAIKWMMSQDDVLLEVFPPRETERSPQTMENFFYLLAGTDKGPNILEKEIDGFTNPMYSLEIVSIAGSIHFYIRTPDKFRTLVESGLYAQYPGVEVVEAQDYTLNVPRILPNKEWKLFGFDYKLQKHDAFPIRTYKKFEEDITGKMIDPLHMLLENMSALGPGQQMWLQYIIQPDSPRWVETQGQAEIDKLLGREKAPSSVFGRLFKDIMDVLSGIFTGFFSPPEYSPFEKESKDEQPVEFRLTPGEKGRLTALEENLAKAFFGVKMRLVVVGKKDGFTKANVSAVNGSIVKPFNDNFHNSLQPESSTKTDADHLFVDAIAGRRTRVLLERYRDRDPSGVTFRFSTEELATVFHMPDMSVLAPGIQFAGSKRGGAPSNLPF